MPMVVDTRKIPLGSIPGSKPGDPVYSTYYNGSEMRQILEHNYPAFQRTNSFRNSNDASDYRDQVADMLYHNEKLNRRPTDTGHEFITWKGGLTRTSHPNAFVKGPSGTYWRGPLILAGVGTGSTGFETYTADSMWEGLSARVGLINRAKGTEFIRSTRPTKSASNLGQLLSELVQQLPAIPFSTVDSRIRDVRSGLKTVGGEYLNARFGWEPMVSDVLKICKAVVYSRDILAQYQKDAGKVVRRKRANPWEKVTDEEGKRDVALNMKYVFPYGTFTSDSLRWEGNYSWEKYEKYSFSGAFTYFITDDSSFLGKMEAFAEKADHLLGIKPDLELLWELAPWSWMVDWFSNIGDIIAICSEIANDSLVLRYAYLMRHTRVTYELTSRGPTSIYSGYVGDLTAEYTFVRKERIRANPYGFETQLENLTDYQWAILAALGFSRAPQKAL